MGNRERLTPKTRLNSKKFYAQLETTSESMDKQSYEPKNGGSSLGEFFLAMEDLAENYEPNGILPFKKNKVAS